MDENEINEHILNAVTIMLDHAIRDLRLDYVGTVKAQSKVKHGAYIVDIDGNNYTVRNGTNIQFAKGNRCLVHCVNGDFKDKLIIAKY